MSALPCKVQTTVACCIALFLALIGAPARAENWEYRADLGGWLDNESGLVWGPVSFTWWQGSYQWGAANGAGVNSYRELTGNPNWRMPSLAEWQTAMAHNASAYFSQTTDFTGYFWTSTAGTGKNKKNAWMVKNMFTGVVELVSQSSLGIFILVYRP